MCSSDLRVTARKEHTCDFCGCAIRVGAAYWRDTLVYDGTIYYWLTHIECMAVAEKLSMFDECGDGGLGPDEFSELVYAYLDSYYLGEGEDDLPDEVESLTMFQKVELIINTWNRPDIALRRKKAALASLMANAFWYRGREADRYRERVDALKKEIEKLENAIEK